MEGGGGNRVAALTVEGRRAASGERNGGDGHVGSGRGGGLGSGVLGAALSQQIDTSPTKVAMICIGERRCQTLTHEGAMAICDARHCLTKNTK